VDIRTRLSTIHLHLQLCGTDFRISFVIPSVELSFIAKPIKINTTLYIHNIFNQNLNVTYCEW
jgi:hypothetical protein